MSGEQTNSESAGIRTAVPSRRPTLRRTVAEAVALATRVAKLPVDAMARELPRGDGHAVLVLPALIRGDDYTEPARRLLTEIGYAAFGWELGVNLGPTKRLLDGAADRLIALSTVHGPLSLVGFSMGGLFARWLSLRMPDRVRQVITVCSPMHEPARNFWLPVEPLLGLWPDINLAELAGEIARPLPVPGTYLFTRDDGIVNCASCWDATAVADNIEISGPHVLIAQSPQVMTIVAQRLARDLAALTNHDID